LELLLIHPHWKVSGLQITRDVDIARQIKFASVAGIDSFESGCRFTGGQMLTPSYWLMKGVCGGEGSDYGAEQIIELQIVRGGLQITNGSLINYYPVKCSDPSPMPIEPRTTFWDHNGSTMTLSVEGDLRRFYYHQVRKGMRAAGARSGSLLFEGRASGNRYSGTAFIFNAKFGQYPYKVGGAILDNGRLVVMSGMAPRINRRCVVIGEKPDALVFRLLP